MEELRELFIKFYMKPVDVESKDFEFARKYAKIDGNIQANYQMYASALAFAAGYRIGKESK